MNGFTLTRNCAAESVPPQELLGIPQVKSEA